MLYFLFYYLYLGLSLYYFNLNFNYLCCFDFLLRNFVGYYWDQFLFSLLSVNMYVIIYTFPHVLINICNVSNFYAFSYNTKYIYYIFFSHTVV